MTKHQTNAAYGNSAYAAHPFGTLPVVRIALGLAMTGCFPGTDVVIPYEPQERSKP